MTAAYIFEWGDERAEGDDSRVGEELPDLRHPPDVLRPVLLRETQVLVQPRPHVVSVEAIGGNAPIATMNFALLVNVHRTHGDISPRDEVLLQGEGHGGLSRPAEAGEPDGAAAKPAAHDLAALRPRNGVLLRVHVRRHSGALEGQQPVERGESFSILFLAFTQPMFNWRRRLIDYIQRPGKVKDVEKVYH